MHGLPEEAEDSVTDILNDLVRVLLFEYNLTRRVEQAGNADVSVASGVGIVGYGLIDGFGETVGIG